MSFTQTGLQHRFALKRTFAARPRRVRPILALTLFVQALYAIGCSARDDDSPPGAVVAAAVDYATRQWPVTQGLALFQTHVFRTVDDAIPIDMPIAYEAAIHDSVVLAAVKRAGLHPCGIDGNLVCPQTEARQWQLLAVGTPRFSDDTSAVVRVFVGVVDSPDYYGAAYDITVAGSGTDGWVGTSHRRLWTEN